MLEETPVVLIVEPDPDLADLYAGWLGDEYAVRVAHDERAALAAADEADAVVLGESATDFSTGTLRDAFDRDGPEAASVVMVGSDDDHGVSTAPDDRVVEPVSAEALRNAVCGVLTRRAYSQGVEELFSVASEMAAIEVGRDEGSDERRRELEERIDELRDRLDDALDSLVETSGFAAAYGTVVSEERDDA